MAMGRAVVSRIVTVSSAGKKQGGGHSKPPEETRFKPGESGNPKGRPKGSRNRSTIARKWLEAMGQGVDLDGNEVELSYEDLITLAQIKKAKESGDTAAYNALVDSAYGKARQAIDITEREPDEVVEIG